MAARPALSVNRGGLSQGPGTPEACPPAEASRGPSRHEGRPKSLNLPPEAKHPADPQRSFKTKTRTPEERPKWPQGGKTLAGPGGAEEELKQRCPCCPQVRV